MNLTTITPDSGSLQITAHFDSWKDASVAQDFEASAVFSTREAAEEFAARFPKSYGFRVTTLSGLDRAGFGTVPGWEHVGNVAFIVKADARLIANGVNGGKNETGVKRYFSILKKADRLGIAVEFSSARAANAYPTREAFEAALA